ncbi:restriction endonuclease subunit S [Streptomyces sp. NPDC051773]|uniref:restriction endonuclease subunit S n=1 Tax=Streptomyces sp. NPDC051773 TaxID=3156682 RepID=UPI003416B349
MPEWQTVPLPEVLDFQEGPGIMAKDFRAEGVPLLRLAGLKRNSALLMGCNFLDSKVVEKRWAHFRLREGDVLLSTSASLGEVAQVDASGVGAIAYTGIIRFRPKNSLVDPAFIQFMLTSPSFKHQIEAMGVGSVMKHFGPSHLRQMTVDVPPVPDQGAIAAVLGALDEKIAVNERVATTALGLAEAIYLQVAESKTWQSARLADAARWMSGGTPKTSEPSYWGGSIPWISALSLKSPWIDRSDRNVTELGARSGTRIAPVDTVLFVVRGSSLKEEFRIGIAQRDVAFGQDCKALIARDGIDPHVLFHGIRSQTAKVLGMVDETSIGAGRLSTDLISNLEIRFPGAQSDAAVAEVRTLDEVAATRQRESQALATLRDTLLPQLMSGRLRVKDAEKIVEDAT